MTSVLRCQQALRACLEAEAARGRPPGRLVVGFSGGLDSSVLLHAAQAVASQPLVAVHVNHGVSEMADKWQTHCAATCRSMAVTLITRKLQPASEHSPSGEAHFRVGRYAAYREIVRAGDVLLLAHHADDLAESVLLHVLQGRGAYGMPRQRPFGDGLLLRPLLELRQVELQAYAEEVNLAWVEDSSNLDTRFDRNLLRIQVLPQLEARFPNLADRLIRVADLTTALQALAVRGVDLAGPTLPVAVLREAEPLVSAQLLRLWLARREEAGAANARRVALTEFIRQLDCPENRQPRLDLPHGSLRRHRGEVFFVPADLAAEPASGALLAPDGGLPATLVLDQGVLSVWEDPHGARPQGPVRIVYRQSGGRLRVNGHHRSVKQLLREAAVPPWERSTYPLLADAAGLLIIPGIATRDDPGPDATPAAVEPRLGARWTPERLASNDDR